MWAGRLFINLIACNINELESKSRFIVLSSINTDSGWNNTFFRRRIFLIHCSFMRNCVWLIDEHWFLSIFFCSFQIVAFQYNEKEPKKWFKKLRAFGMKIRGDYDFFYHKIFNRNLRFTVWLSWHVVKIGRQKNEIELVRILDIN